MQFIDDYIAQVLETLRPFGVMREDATVQHIWIRQNHVGPLTNGAPRILWSVAVVGERADLRPNIWQCRCAGGALPRC
jgi:hypothetical protein